jgi:ABC-2 type transport system ATP-binding protein
VTSDVAIEIEGVTLTYGGGVRALDGLSLQVPPGCHGLLGPNGAGKSSLIKVLLGLLRPDSGRGRVLGRDIRQDRQEVRRRVGYMPERDAHVPGMIALDNVSMMGELSGMRRRASIKRAHEVLHYVGLGEARYRPVDGFSAGMRQRLKLAVAIVHDPDLLLLDEPTNGLDPRGRRDMLDLVHELARSGINVLLSTHLLPDLQEACREVVVMNAGRVVRQGRVEELTRGAESTWRVGVLGDDTAFREGLDARSVKHARDPLGHTIVVTLPAGLDTSLLMEVAAATGSGIQHLAPGARSLEEVFLESIAEPDDARS